MTTQTELDDLLVDEQSLNEEQLKEVLAPYAGIGNDSGAFVPTDKFGDLNSFQQTAVVLLHRKAAHELGLAEKEGVSPSEIASASGINHNTVKPAVRQLDEDGIVENHNGEYTVPTYNYDKVRELIESN